MIQKIKNIFNSKDNKKLANIDCSFEHVQEPHKFLLKYQNDEIGQLSYDGNEGWTFEYSDWFKTQVELQPLFEFPNVNKIYKSKELWPFFGSRIPSEKQPKVQEYIEAHPSDKGNLAKLLAVFGNSSVNNPYKLITL